MGYTAADKVAIFLPLFHVFAQNTMMNAAFESGATIHLFRRFEPRTLLRTIAQEGITMLFGVASAFATLLALRLDEHDLSSLRFEVAGAAPLPDELTRRWQERFGRPINQGYGLTETAPLTNVNVPGQQRIGSVGKCVPGVGRASWRKTMPRFPPAAGRDCFRGANVMQGYWNRPGRKAARARAAWFHTDIGKIDADGYLFIVDRVKDMINAAGLKVWPAVEQCIYRHPAVLEAAVYGAPHRLRGEDVCGCGPEGRRRAARGYRRVLSRASRPIQGATAGEQDRTAEERDRENLAGAASARKAMPSSSQRGVFASGDTDGARGVRYAPADAHPRNH
jgi:long-chain acyl-CoA synthetase